MTKYWIGVASLEHAKAARRGGFCQLGHGKAKPVQRLSPGDGIAYYAPKEKLGSGEAVQAFVTIGRVCDGEAYEAHQGDDFHPTRRDVSYFGAICAPIRPLLDDLAFITNRSSWGTAFRRGAFQVSSEDFLLIAEAMGVAARFRN